MTLDEYKKIRNYGTMYGYEYTSVFMRELALHPFKSFEDKLKEINDTVKYIAGKVGK